MPQIGRKKILTDVKEITRENIIEVLQKAYSIHKMNARRIQELIDIDRGIQPLKRRKTKRKDIDIRVCDNISNYVKKFNVGYFWSNTIMLVQRGNKEMHNTDESVDNAGINALNEMLGNGERIGYKDQWMAEFLEIGGIGHQLVDVKTDFEDEVLQTEDGEYVGSLVNVYTLDSRYAFCVYNNGVGQKKLMGVTYAETDDGVYFTCFTDKERFEIHNDEILDEQINPLGRVSIVEYERSFDRTGCFERILSMQDSLNVMVSDLTNDIAQRTQEIWWGNDLDFPKDETTGKTKTPESGQWVLTSSGADKNPKIQPLSSTSDNQSTLSSIDKQRNWILQMCNVPIQYDTSGGGSTGVAMDISSGWNDAEIAAMQKQQMIEKGKREELELILKAISLVDTKVLPADSQIRKVHSTDVNYKFIRRKNLDISTKSNALCALLSHGINGRHALIAADIFADVEQVWADSKEGIELYQKYAYENAAKQSTEQTGMQDMSDQLEQSPILKEQNS